MLEVQVTVVALTDLRSGEGLEWQELLVPFPFTLYLYSNMRQRLLFLALNGR